MKTFLISLLLCFVSQISHAIVQFEVQPLSLKSKHQVIGVQAGSTSRRAIIFTGPTAQRVADAARMPFNASREMIVMTGTETASLVGTTIGATYVAGKLVVLTAGAFAYAGMKLAFTAIYAGAAVAWLGVTTATTVGKLAVYYTLKGLQVPYYVAAGTGIFLVRASAGVVVGTLEYVCQIPRYFSFGLLRCGY